MKKVDRICSVAQPMASALVGSLRSRTALVGALIVVLAVIYLALPSAFAAEPVLNETQTKGQNLAFERSKGNCLACHHMEGGTLAGTVGPPLLQMRARFPDRAVLREQISDARIRNPKTIMPPFEAHGILNAEEIDAIVDFLYAL